MTSFFFETCLALLSIFAVGTDSSSTYGDGSVHAEFQVFCDDTNLVVYFNKTALDERTIPNVINRTYTIAFDGETSSPCLVTANDMSNVDTNAKASLPKPSSFVSTIYLSALFDNCSITAVFDSSNIIYKQTVIVTYGNNPTPNIIREEKDTYTIMCLRNRTAQLKTNFNNTKHRADGSDAKNATSNFGLTLKHSDINDVKQPAYKLGQFIKFTLSSTTLRKETKAVVQKCWATDGSSNEYVLIDNRCDLESGTSFVIDPSDATTIWKTEAFRYSSAKSIYVECLVNICLDADKSTPCTLCTKSSRRRRSVDGTEHTEIAVVKSGAFIVIEKEKSAPASTQKSTSFFNGRSGITVVVLLAVIVVLISAVIIKRFCCTPYLIAAARKSRRDSEEDEDATTM